MSLGPQVAKSRSAYQVSLAVEGIADGGMVGGKTLGRALALELLLLSLPSSDGQVGILGAIFLAHAALSVTACEPEYNGRNAIRRQITSDDGLGMDVLVAEQFPRHFQSRVLVSALLDQDVQDLALIIDYALEVHAPAGDLHDHLVQVPAEQCQVNWQRTEAPLPLPNLGVRRLRPRLEG